jgi:RHS repeat-associated protein
MCAPLPTCFAGLDLGYDANGNVVSKTTPAGVTSFTYDPLDRIDPEAGPAGARNHDFDAGGNRTTDGAGTTAGFTPNTDRLAAINGVAVTLDAAGNLVSDGTYQYLWNSLGQLAELRKPDHTLIATYHYDHRNLRTRKVTTAAAPQGAGKTFYHYDQAGRLIAETTPGNTPQATYIWNGDILTGFIVHQPTRTVYTVQTDHLGSPFQVRTLAGQVVWRWESEAFGRTPPNEDVDGDGNKLTLNLRFPGQYFDRESGLHYNWHRYYSPRLGRYVQVDPIGIAGGLNVYEYARSNPLSYTDPLGLWSIGFELYGGIGGGINASYSNGTLELTGRVGVGLGGGFGYEPQGEPSPHSKKCGSGHIARTTANIQAGIGVGPFGIGRSFTAASGNAVTHKVGGGYSSASKSGLSVDNGKSIGARFGGSVGVDIGSYSNWGDQQCGCQ